MAFTLFPAGTPASDAASTDQPLVMALPDGSVITAGTLDEALDSIIPGYSALADSDEGASFEARIAFARAFAAARTEMFDRAVSGDLPEEAKLGGEPILASQVPQVLVTVDFAPHSEVQPPSGSVEWINPVTELTLLESLHASGDYQLWVSVGDQS